MKKRVLFILHLPPPVHGAGMVGQQIKTSSLINEAFESYYVNLSTSTTLNEIGSSAIKKYLTLLKILLKVFRILWTKKLDLCYVTLTAKGAGFYKDLFIVALLKLFGKKIVFHFHNKGVLKASRRSLNNLLYKWTFYNTSSILLSSHLYNDVKKYVRIRDVYFCPNGIADATIEKKTCNKKGFGRFNILFLSNMMKEKGVVILLEACKILRDRGLDFECHFVGSWSDITGPMFDKFLQQLELREIAFAHGPKYGEEKAPYFERADVFAFPTFYHNEAFPLVNLEAMSYSLPVISTAEGGIPDMIVDGENGFLIPSRNASLLADRIEVLAKSPETSAKFGVAGRRRFENLYSSKEFERNFREILTRLTS